MLPHSISWSKLPRSRAREACGEQEKDAGGAERPSEGIGHPDAGRLPLTLSWKRAQPAEARMLQTGDLVGWGGGEEAAHSGSD